MDFRLDELEALPGVVARQLDEVEQGIAEGDLHRLRKATKRLRALLGLVAPALKRKRAAEDDRLLRDLARLAAGGRDAEVVARAFDDLAPHLDAPVEAVEATRQALRDEVARSAGTWDPGAAQELVERLRRRTARWTVTEAGAEAGARSVLARARKGMRRAERRRSAEALHDWRKDVKRHWHHVELLGDPGRAEQVHAVADRLGDDHDLAVLLERAADVPGLAALVEARRAALQEEAFDLGEGLFSGKPKLAAAQLVAGLPVP